MQNTLIANNFNPLELAKKKSIEEQIYKMNLGAEMFIAQSASVYYVDMMSEVDSETQATSRSVLSWLEDKDYATSKSLVNRTGLLTMYSQDNKDHFTDGKWNACYFNDYIFYLLTYLTDKNYTNKMAKTYKQSVLDKHWFNQFVALAGIKMLERQLKKGLHSTTAMHVIQFNNCTRDHMKRLGSLIGRSTKNHDAYSTQSELKATVNQMLQDQSKLIKSILISRAEESKILEEYEKDFNQALLETQKNISLIA